MASLTADMSSIKTDVSGIKALAANSRRRAWNLRVLQAPASNLKFEPLFKERQRQPATANSAAVGELPGEDVVFPETLAELAAVGAG